MITPGTVAVGRAIWLTLRPWRRLKVALNKRRARLGKPLLKLSEDDMELIPSGTFTKGAAGAAIATQVVTLALNSVGVGECTAAEVIMDAGCIGGTQIAGGIVTVIFAMLAWYGRNRAQRMHEAQMATEVAAARAEK
ncbi:MAG: hypothetical protein ABI640_12855 [Gammaproteobacteria bacterium]